MPRAGERAPCVRLAGLALLACIAIGWAQAFAARPVRVYEVTVHASDPGPWAQQAMREVLVRATGRADAATDPALAPLIADAGRYVSGSQSLADGSTLVTFDGPAVERQIIAAGRAVWDPQRPFTLVVLSPPPTGAAGDDLRRSLELIAERRGLPATLVPMALVDASGGALTNDALLTSAQRLGADDVLLGRTDPAAPSGEWQWTLLTGLSTESWTGTFEAGIEGAADALARVQSTSLPLGDQDALVQVSGVSTLTDYASVERLLDSLPGVRRSGLEAADGATVTFRVLIRGGAQAVEHALATSPHFTHPGMADTRLTYQFER